MDRFTDTSFCDAQPAEWRAVVGYEGLYEVSEAGEVRRIRFINNRTDKLLDPPRLMRPRLDRGGYARVCLTQGGRGADVYVATIVAAAFLGPKPPGLQVAHNDGVRAHNHWRNLRYASALENSHDKYRHGTMIRGQGAKLTPEIVRLIRTRCRKGSRAAGLSALAREFGVTVQSISAAVDGRTWKWVST